MIQRLAGTIQFCAEVPQYVLHAVLLYYKVVSQDQFYKVQIKTYHLTCRQNAARCLLRMEAMGRFNKIKNLLGPLTLR